MKLCVVDASVLVKVFLNEDYSERAVALISSGSLLVAPDLIWAEFGNVLWKHERRGLLDRYFVATFCSHAMHLPIETHPSRDLLMDAVRISVLHDRTVYDSLYLALAVQMKCPFVTGDQKLVRSLAKSSLSGSLRFVGEV